MARHIHYQYIFLIITLPTLHVHGSREITPSNENWKDNLTAECYRRCMSMMNGVNPHLLPKVPGCCCDGMMYNYVASPPFAPVYSLSQQLMNHQDFPYKQPYMRPQSRMSDPEDLWRQAEKTSHFYRTEDASVPIRTSYQGINVSLNSMQEATVAGQLPNGSSADMSHFPSPLHNSTHGIRSPRRNALTYARRNYGHSSYRSTYRPSYMRSAYSKPYYPTIYRNNGQQMYRSRGSWWRSSNYRGNYYRYRQNWTPMHTKVTTAPPVWKQPYWQAYASYRQTPTSYWQTHASYWPAKTTTVTTSTTTKPTSTTTTTPKPTTTTTPKPTTTTTTTTPKPTTTTTTPKLTTTTTTTKPTTTTTTPKPTTTTTTTTPKPTTTTTKPTTTTTTPKPTTTTTKPTTTTTTPKPTTTTTTTTTKPTTTTTTTKPTTTTTKPTTTTTTPTTTTTTTTPKPTTTTTTPTTTTTKATTPTTTTTTPTTSTATTKKTTTTIYTPPTTTESTTPTTTTTTPTTTTTTTTPTTTTTTPTTTTPTPTTTTPTTTTTTPTTTTPTTTTSTHTTMSEPVCDYSAFSRYHVRITEETNEHCSIKWKIKVSETEQKEILEKHNTYRQEVARGNYGSQIAAANMQVLHWNQELADNAQSMADKCEEGYTNSPSQLRVCSQDYNVSENYYYIWSSNNITNIKSWTQVIDSWYDQGKDLSTSFYLGLNLTSAREYAQLVWANAYEVGCGGAYTETDIGITIRYFCLYGPGIMMDQPLYHYGPPATDCNGPVSSTYNDLCVNIPAEKEIHVVEPPRTSLAS